MRITLTSVMVDDQDKALQFYTDKLGFQKKFDVPMGGHRWITHRLPMAPNLSWNPTNTQRPSHSRRLWFPTASRSPLSRSTTCMPSSSASER